MTSLSSTVNRPVSSTGTLQHRYGIALALVISLFFVWGLTYGLLMSLISIFSRLSA